MSKPTARTNDDPGEKRSTVNDINDKKEILKSEWASRAASQVRIAALLPGWLLLAACADDGGADGDEAADSTDTDTDTDTDGSGGDTDSSDGTDDGATDGTDDGDIEATFEVELGLASDIDPSAPGTVGIVTWSSNLEDITDASLQFGLDDTYGSVAPVDLLEPEYRTLLLGMKPNRTYHVRVAARSGGVEYYSDDYTIETGTSTNLVNIEEFNVSNEAARERGFMLTSSWERQGGGMGSAAYILDADGEVVWWYQSTIGSISAARMSADGKRVWLITAAFDNGAIEWVTMDTLESQVFSDLGSPSHDIYPVVDDVMAYLDYGMPNHPIIEIDPMGNTEVASTLEGVTVEHSNAIRYYPSEDLYVYSDWQYDVYGINRTNGTIEWALSDLTSTNWGGVQHGVHLLDDSLLIFANNGGSGSTAAAMEFSRSDGSLLFAYQSGLQTRNLGEVQRLPAGNTLMTCSTAGRIHEVDPSGNLVMSVRTSALGYTRWRESLYGPPQTP